MKRKIIGFSLVSLFFMLGMWDAHYLWEFYNARTDDTVLIPVITIVGLIPLFIGVGLCRGERE